MSTLKEQSEFEELLLEELHSKHIRTEDISAYYTLLTGLRLRLFEGILTLYLEEICRIECKDPQGNHWGLNNKIKTIVTDLKLIHQYQQLLSTLRQVRNRILHGDFNLTIEDKTIWEETNKFLKDIEYKLIEDKNHSISFSINQARSLKQKLQDLY